MIRSIVFVLATLLASCAGAPAFAAPITTVTGSAWPTSGAASAATVGIYQLSANWTHVGASSSDLWPTAAADGATGYLRANPAQAVTLRVDSAGPGTGTAGAKYTVSLWLRPRLINPTLPNLADGASFRLMDHLGGASAQIINTVTLRKRTTAPEGYSGLSSAQAAFNVSAPTVSSAYGSPLNAVFQLDRWQLVTLFIRAGAAGTAEYGWGVNGQVYTRIGSSTDTIGTLSLSSYTGAQLDVLTFQFPAWTDVEWQIGGIKSESGTGAAYYTDTPDANNSKFSTPSRYDLAFHWPAGFIDSGAQEGGNWAWTATAGSPTEAVSQYSAVGTNPNRRFRIATGAAASDAGNWLSKRAVGTLPYNAEGWATVFLPMVMTTGSATVTIDLLASNNTTVLHRLQLGPSFVTYDNGTGTTDRLLVTAGASVRYAPAFMLNSDGRAGVALFRMTDDAGGTVYSTYPLVQWMAVDTWTPQALGKIKVSAAFTANGEVVHFDGAAGHRYLDVAAVDSYTQANSATASPTMSTVSTRACYVYSCMRENEAAGGVGFFIPANTSLPVLNFALSVGWSGHRGDEFFQRNGRILRGIPGLRVVVFGGIVNDINAYATSVANGITYGTRWAEQLAQFAQGVVGSESHFMWCTPIWGTGAAFLQTGSRTMFDTGVNLGLQYLTTRFDPRGRMIIHQTSTAVVAGADGIHPDETQAAQWAQEAAGNEQVYATPVLLRNRGSLRRVSGKRRDEQRRAA